jgi:MFS transporter, putative metabolite:H+ symporter
MQTDKCKSNSDKIDNSIWLMLILVGGAYLTSRYDFQLSTLTIPQFQKDLFLSDAHVQKITALVKLGAIPAILITFFADKFGRKPIFLMSVIGFSIAAIYVSLAKDSTMLLIGLFFTRLFTMIGELLAVVLIAEAAPNNKRGLLLGLLAVFGTMGDAIALLGYGFIGDNPDSWRIMYKFGALPFLLAIIWFFTLKESKAYEKSKVDHFQGIHPIEALKTHKKPLFIISISLICYWIPMSPALTLISQFLQNDLGWQPAGVTKLSIIAGIVGMVGTIYGGKLCDIWGRKIVSYISIIMSGIGMLLAYNINSFFGVVCAYGLGLLGYFAFMAASRAIVTESVDTQSRATAVSATEVFSTFGAFFGVHIVGLFADNLIKTNNSLLYLSPFLILSLIALGFVKETKGKILS